MEKLPLAAAPIKHAPDSPAASELADCAKAVSPALLAAKRLEECREEWRAAAGKAREKLWTLLAAIFVAHDYFNEKVGGREFMVEWVRNMPDYTRGELDPNTKSLLELLVIYAIGFERDTAASRCQYLAAVKAAVEDPDLQRTEEAFLAWLKRKGGIIAAGTSNRESNELAVPFRFSVFKDHMATMARRGTIEFPVDPDSEVDGGLTVILASVDPEQPNQLHVIDAVGDESVIQRVAQAVVTHRAKKLPQEARQALLNDQHLWELNSVALKLAKKLSGKVTWADADRWHRAHMALEGQDKNDRKWFSGFSRVPFTDPSGTDKLSLTVEHPEFHALDPGRYIKEAREGMLMPYDPSDPKALDRYIRKHTDPNIYAKPIELAEAGTPIATVPRKSRTAGSVKVVEAA